jgi:hypothetical protein
MAGSRTEWALPVSPTCLANGRGSARCLAFRRTNPAFEPTPYQGHLRRRETQFSRAETKLPEKTQTKDIIVRPLGPDRAAMGRSFEDAYGVRVSAYGVSHQWLRRPRKRLRSGPGHTFRSARLPGPARPACAPPAGYVQPAIDFAHFEHLIARKHLLPIPRPGRHSHFSVRLALDDDGGLVAGREFFENFFGRVCSHKSFRPEYRLYRLGEANGVTCNGERYVYRCYAKSADSGSPIWIADSLKGLLSDLALPL